MIKKKMRIKKFEQLYENISQDRIKEFRDRVEKLIKSWDEAMEEEPENEPSHSELLDEVGEIMNEFDLSTQDIRDIVAAYPKDHYIDYYVKPILDYEEEEIKKEDALNEFITETLSNHDVEPNERTLNAVHEILEEVIKDRETGGVFKYKMPYGSKR